MVLVRLSPLRVAQIPSATERLIKTDDHKQLIALGLSEGVFRWEQQLLCFQNLEVAGSSRVIPKKRQTPLLPAEKRPGVQERWR